MSVLSRQNCVKFFALALLAGLMPLVSHSDELRKTTPDAERSGIPTSRAVSAVVIESGAGDWELYRANGTLSGENAALTLENTAPSLLFLNNVLYFDTATTITKTGTGTTILRVPEEAGTGAAFTLNANQMAGETVLTGVGPINLSGAEVNYGTLTMTNTVVQATGNLQVGRTDGRRGRLQLENATLDFSSGSLNVLSGGIAIGEGTAITGSVNLGTSYDAAVVQSGGEVIVKSFSEVKGFSYFCQGGSLHYQLTGGTLKMLSQIRMGQTTAGSAAVEQDCPCVFFEQTGGTYSGSFDAMIGRGWGNWSFRGGTATGDNLSFATSSSSANSCCVVTIDGGAVVSTHVRMCAADNTSAIINLNGGSWAWRTIATGAGADAFSGTTTYVQFNGGTVSVRNNTNIGGGLFAFSPPEGSSISGYSPYRNNLFDITVFGGGAAIDIPSGCDRTLYEPLKPATGSGLASIELPPSSEKYSAAPIVKIVGGDGHGATAEAIMSGPANGQKVLSVTGYRITSPGVGYTVAPSAILCRSRMAANVWQSRTCACTLAANAPDGGFTKKGKGTLTLNAASTYAGPTTIAAGTLKYGIADALPDGTPLTIAAGATLNLNSFAETLAFPLGGGAVKGDCTISGTCALKAADVATNCAVTVTGAVTLDGLTLTLDDPSALTDHDEHVILKTTGGITGDLPAPYAIPSRSARIKFTLSDDGKSLICRRHGAGIFLIIE